MTSVGLKSIRSARLWLVFGLWVLLLVALHALCLAVYPEKQLDPWGNSDYWPFSVFRFHLPVLWQGGMAVLAWGVFAVLLRAVQGRRPSTVALCFGSWALIVTTSLLYGWHFGIDYPTATWGASGFEYYHDALQIKSAAWFLSHFQSLEPVLNAHSVTHPPGAVLFYSFLHRICVAPALVSIYVCAISLVLALPAWRRLIERELKEKVYSAWAVLLYAILPAVQIYFLAVLDAVIAGLLLVALDRFLDRDKAVSALWAAVAVTAASFLSHGFLWILPVLVAYEWLRHGSLRRSTLVFALLGVFYSVLYLRYGYDHGAAFLQASVSENPGGFLGFVDFRKYFWYRLGSVLEILTFFTPFLLVLLPKGIKALRQRAPHLWTLCWLGLASLGAMLLAGALQVGEAARVCLFILPCLLLPVVALMTSAGVGDAERQKIARWVFAQVLVMFLFGFYQW